MVSTVIMIAQNMTIQEHIQVGISCLFIVSSKLNVINKQVSLKSALMHVRYHKFRPSAKRIFCWN